MTSFFVMLLLFSVGISQGLHSGSQEQEGLSNVSRTEGKTQFATSDAVAAPSLTITPITWGVVGLDSNRVTEGPSLFPVGARVCNTGGDPATNVVSTFVWNSANALINLRIGSVSTLNLATLAAGACTDFYYEVEVTRSTAAYNTTRAFQITVTANTLGTISTPTPREIFVEKLVSQNRNSVISIKLNNITVPFGGTMNLVVGNTYTIELNASTATNGYEQIESFINLPNVVFQTLGVSSTYTAPTGYIGSKLYEDGCGWDPVPTSPTYRSCLATGKTGGTVKVIYTVKILSGAGISSTLNTLIYDFSGSSYHYNSDFSATAVIAQISFAPSSASATISGRVLTASGNGIRNARVFLTEEDGTVHNARTGSFGYYVFEDIPGGQNVIVSIASKRFSFPQTVRLVTLSDDVTELDWISNE